MSAKTFVLVHGAWIGPWYWRDVEDRLRAAGHRVFSPSLSGMGARRHQLSPDIDLATHIQDVLSLIEDEQISDIVLVGHSYGGMVISGVADAAPKGTISAIVFLDAFLPESGQSMVDIIGPEAAAQVYGDADPIPIPHFLAEGDPVMQSTIPRTTPQPRQTKFQPVGDVSARESIPTKVFVRAAGGGSFHDPTVARLSQDSTWQVVDISTGHDMMLEDPKETARILMEAA